MMFMVYIYPLCIYISVFHVISWLYSCTSLLIIYLLVDEISNQKITKLQFHFLFLSWDCTSLFLHSLGTISSTNRSFLGLARYYRKFIENFSRIACPMTALQKKENKFLWPTKCEKSFDDRTNTMNCGSWCGFHCLHGYNKGRTWRSPLIERL